MFVYCIPRFDLRNDIMDYELIWSLRLKSTKLSSSRHKTGKYFINIKILKIRINELFQETLPFRLVILASLLG